MIWEGAIRRESKRKKGLKASRDKNARHEPWWGGGTRACFVYDPGSELRLSVGGTEKEGRKNQVGLKKRGKKIERVLFPGPFRSRIPGTICFTIYTL